MHIIALYNKFHFTQEHQPCLFNVLMKFNDLCMPYLRTNFLLKDLPAKCIALGFDFHYVHNIDLGAIYTFLFNSSVFMFAWVKARPVIHRARRNILSGIHT